MFYVLQNESDGNLRRVPILLTDAATGTTAQTGIASTNIFPSVNINGGAFAGGAGTVGEAGFGQYYYQMDPTEVGTLGLAGIHITAVGCRDYDAIAQIAAFNVYSAAGLGISAGDVWNYDISAISTAGSAGTQLNLAAAGGGSITAADVWNYVLPVNSLSAELTLNNADYQTQTAQLSNSVWNIDISTYTSPSAGYDLTQAASGGAGLTAGDVWDYDLSAYNVLGNSAGSYLFFNTDKIFSNLDIPSSSIASSTWSYVTRTLTSGAGLTVGDVSNAVWNSPVASYGTNGTFGKLVLRSDAANKVGDVTLYSAGGINGVDADVHRIANDTAAATAWKNILTGIGSSITGNITGNLTGSVGSVSGNVGGNVTGSVGSVVGAVGSVTSPVSVATASMTGIAGTVWSVATRTITGGTITTVSDKTGYSLSGTQSFNLTGNITGSVSGSVGSVTGSVGSVVSAVSLSTATQASIANSVWSTNILSYTQPSAGYSLATAGSGGISPADVWSYATRTITGGIADTVTTATSVTNPVSISTASLGSIGSTVWNYVLSDAQTADTNLVAAGSGGIALTAGDVWSYNTRTLTSGAGITVIGAVQLVNGPYRLTSNQNNSDGILDILQNSVQEINLNLIDGNGAPASTAGYASVVNIYDVAGVAVTTYSPVVEYADGGVLTFELDTDVTSTIGRYNLIVGLSGAGFNVKYGPLQILVRPL